MKMKSNEYNINLCAIFLILTKEYFTFEVQKKKSYIAKKFIDQHLDIIMLLLDVVEEKITITNKLET